MCTVSLKYAEREQCWDDIKSFYFKSMNTILINNLF